MLKKQYNKIPAGIVINGPRKSFHTQKFLQSQGQRTNIISSGERYKMWLCSDWILFADLDLRGLEDIYWKTIILHQTNTTLWQSAVIIKKV